MKSRARSLSIFNDLKKVIPGGVNSPVRAFCDLDMTPIVVARAYEDMLVDEDGNEYIDFCNSWGALIHGHAHPKIVEAVQERLKCGTSYGCTTAIEGELARKIISHVPSVEKVRFVSSGTEAAMSAVRLARGFTGKNGVIAFSGCYHGHSDTFLIDAGSGMLGQRVSLGVPEEHVKWTLKLPYNDIEAFDAALQDDSVVKNLAVVILEPIAANMGLVPAEKPFLEHVRKRCTELGALLIFDEVISGFRFGLSGAEGVYGVTPDLSCFGKIIGGGFPCGAFGGRSDVMDMIAPVGGVYQAGTLSGNPIAMCAGLVSIELCEQKNFYEDLRKKTEFFILPIKEFIEKRSIPIVISHLESSFTFFFSGNVIRNAQEARKCNKNNFASFYKELFSRGVYMPPAQQEIGNISSAHTESHLCVARDTIMEYLSYVYT